MNNKTLKVTDSLTKLVVTGGPSLIVRKDKPKIITVGIQGPQGIQGLQGDQGLPGIDGDKTYVHTQSVASASWTVNHQLNKKPSVTVVDSADTVVVGDITYIDTDSLTINFTGAFSGQAYIN